MENNKRGSVYSTNLNIRISKDLKDKLDRVARQNGVRASELIRAFIMNLEEK